MPITDHGFVGLPPGEQDYGHGGHEGRASHVGGYCAGLVGGCPWCADEASGLEGPDDRRDEWDDPNDD